MTSGFLNHTKNLVGVLPHFSHILNGGNYKATRNPDAKPFLLLLSEPSLHETMGLLFWCLVGRHHPMSSVRCLHSHVCRGQTRLLSTTTEAQSYMALATSADVFHSPAPFLRATTEDYALDSFQNLLFSIARFHEYTGHYPIEITVVGYEFKRLRFIDLHRTAIRWPIQRFHYIGIDPEDGHNLTAAEEGEVGCEHFMSYFLSDIFSESLVICLFPTTHMDVTLYSSRRDDKGIHSSDSIRTTRRVQSCSRYLIGVRLLAMEAKLHYSKAIYLGTDRASFDLMGYSLNVSIPSVR